MQIFDFCLAWWRTLQGNRFCFKGIERKYFEGTWNLLRPPHAFPFQRTIKRESFLFQTNWKRRFIKRTSLISSLNTYFSMAILKESILFKGRGNCFAFQEIPYFQSPWFIQGNWGKSFNSSPHLTPFFLKELWKKSLTFPQSLQRNLRNACALGCTIEEWVSYQRQPKRNPYCPKQCLIFFEAKGFLWFPFTNKSGN